MAQQDVDRGVQTLEEFRKELTHDQLDVAKKIKALDLKVARLERLVEDLRRRVDLLETDASS
jgi:cell division protein FtsB